MKVLFVASESVPFAKTGGLADVIGSLPKALRGQGIDVRVMIPNYSEIADAWKRKMKRVWEMTVPVGWRNQYCGVDTLHYDGIPYYFIDNEYYFNRSECYGHFDDGERFAFFNRAVLEVLPHLDFKPDIIHCHDWHTGMISVFLHSHFAYHPFYRWIRTVFTIHNMKYQGIFPYSILHDLLDLGDEYFTVDGVEYYGRVSFMKGALNYSDMITTVSPNYAAEIQTPFFGEGLDGLLCKKSGQLRGILNGIDLERYNPRKDPDLFFPFKDREGKKKNKLQLQEVLGLPVAEDVPMVAIISRLVEQKGLDLVLCVLEELISRESFQLVVLGTGESRFEEAFRKIGDRYPDKCSVHFTFNEQFSHQIYAAADLFLMPSLFEPCGIGQMIALRYGAVPVVRETGGLRDTVEPYNEYTGKGNGFSFANYNAHEMMHTLCNALKLYRNKDVWPHLVHHAMNSNFSWSTSAAHYGEVYRQLVKL